MPGPTTTEENATPLGPCLWSRRAGRSAWLSAFVLGAVSAALGQAVPPAPQTAASAEHPGAGGPVEGPTPLASCRVLLVRNDPPRDQNIISGALLIDNQPTDDPLMDYLPLLDPTGGGEPANNGASHALDADSSRLRVLVTSPNASRVIDFQVRIDGVPFRDRRRAWLDNLIEQGPARRQLREAGRVLTSVAAAVGQAAKIEPLAPESIAPHQRQAPTLRGRVANYLAAVGHDVDRREITALLNQWPTGPAVTVLTPGRSWQRAGVAPLLATLDADADGTLSNAEIADAPRRLVAADANQDDVVQLTELGRGNRRRAMRQRGGRLLTVIDPAGEWRSKLSRAGISFADPDRIANGPADIKIAVEFGRNARVELLTVVGVQAEAITAADVALGIDYGAERYEISAAAPTETSNEKIEQVAIGAAFDGSPLLRLLNTDNDNRLTLQEQRRLPELLTSLDRDGDGAIAVEEVPVPIRIVVARGAIAHEPLGATAAAVQAFQPSAPQIAAPDWFPPMDANRDGVLTRDEFPGGGEQFKSLDANGDGLINASEAAALEG